MLNCVFQKKEDEARAAGLTPLFLKRSAIAVGLGLGVGLLSGATVAIASQPGLQPDGQLEPLPEPLDLFSEPEDLQESGSGDSLAPLSPSSPEMATVACNEITEAMGFTVRSVEIVGRWVPADLRHRVETIVGLGQRFSPTVLAPAELEVSRAITATETRPLGSSLGTTSVLYVTTDVCENRAFPQQVDVTIRPYYVRVDLLNIGANILPVPRSNEPTFYDRVPAALLATRPVIESIADRQYGPALSFTTQTDLFNLPGSAPADEPGQPQQLLLNVEARRSLQEPFHDLNTSLEYRQPNYGDRGPGWSLGGQYRNQLQPLGEARSRQEGGAIAGAIQGRRRRAIVDAYRLGGELRWTQQTYTSSQGKPLQTTEPGLTVYALTEGRLGAGLSRLGLWGDVGFPGDAKGAYQRLAARAGYALELGAGHNSVGLEVTLGGGYLWGNAPDYGRFFGGNTAGNHLYEPLTAASNQAFPTGPILRSFGEGEAALFNPDGSTVGGRAYWHFNLNLAFPIAQWSRPLIPDITISERQGRRITFRSVLKGQATTAQAWIYDDLVNQGYPDDETTETLATQIVDQDIRPALNYLADRANLYAIKPVLLFDVAQIQGQGTVGYRTWAAVGAGVQVNVVNARLETGYMHTIAPRDDAGQGNFFWRLIFQNLF